MKIPSKVEKDFSLQSKKGSALFKSITWVRGLQLPLVEKAVMFGLASRVDPNLSCFPSIEKLCRDTGLRSSAHVCRILKKLKERGLIEVHKRPPHAGRFIRNSYVLKVGSASNFTPPSVAQKATDELPAGQPAECSADNSVCSTSKVSNPALSSHVEADNLEEDLIEDSSGSEPSVTGTEALPINLQKSGKKKELTSNPAACSTSNEPTPAYLLKMYQSLRRQGVRTPLDDAPYAGPILGYDSTPEKIRLAIVDILKLYQRNDPTPKTIVGFWWALKHRCFPKTKYQGQQSLPNRQYGRLTLLFHPTKGSGPLDAFDLVAWVFAHWRDIVVASRVHSLFEGTSTYPTPSFIWANADELWEWRRQQQSSALANSEAPSETGQSGPVS